MKKIAVVTGTRSGLGLATSQALLAKGYEVVLAHRDPEKVPNIGAGAHVKKLDVADPQSISEFGKSVLEEFQRVDVLVNNAGIFLNSQTDKDVLQSFRTNTLGPILLIQEFLPTMLKNNFGRIVNVSSQMGQLSEMDGSYLAYRVSKTGLNAVTKTFAAEARGKNVLINSVCPGWVRTDMGGAGATRSIEEGIMGLVWAATLPDGGPSGGFFRDGKPLAW